MSNFPNTLTKPNVCLKNIPGTLVQLRFRYSLFLAILILPGIIAAQSRDSLQTAQKIDSLIKYAWNSTNQRHFSQALEIIEVAKSEIYAGFSEDHPLMAYCTFTEGRIYHYRGDLDTAISLYNKSLGLYEHSIWNNSLDYAKNLVNLGSLYKRYRNFDDALTCYQRAQSIFSKTLGEATVDNCLFLNSIGTIYISKEEYNEAEKYFLKAREILNRLDTTSESFYAELARNLDGFGVVHRNTGKLETALEYVRQAKEIRAQLPLRYAGEYLNSLLNLAALNSLLTHYANALDIYEEFDQLLSKLYPKPNLEYFRFRQRYLHNTAVILTNLGQYQQADSRLQDVFEINQNHFLDTTTYLAALAYLVHLEDLQGKYQKAISDSEFLIKFLEEHKSTNANLSVRYFEALIQMVQQCFRIRDIERARYYLNKAAGQLTDEVKLHPYFYPYYLKNKALLALADGKAELARKYTDEAISIVKEKFGESNEQYYNYAMMDANVSFYNNEPLKGFASALLYQSGKQKKLTDGISYLSNAELLSLSNAIRDANNRLFSIPIVFGSNTELKHEGKLYDVALFEKGFLLEASKARDLLYNIRSDTLYKTYDDWRAIKRLLGEQYARPLQEQKNVEALESQASVLEKQLIRSVKGFGNALKQVHWQELKSRLDPGEAAVEFVHVQYYDPAITDSIFYAALVLRPEDQQPCFIPLFEEKQLDQLLENQSADKTAFLNQLYGNKNSNQLYQLIWQPLDSLLQGMKTIYASPSGLLHRINLGAVMTDNSHTFSDRYKLVTLGSTRQLVFRDKKPAPTELTAAVYGGIFYEMDSTAIAQANQQILALNKPEDQFTFSYRERSEPERSGQSWDYLKGTEEEAGSIRDLIIQKNGRVDLYTGYNATEESFEHLGQSSASPRVLHIATHGYFSPDPVDTVKNDPFFLEGLNDAPAFKISEHPMIRSGLIMAGGNHVWLGNPKPEGLEDGILTAYEVSQANLEGTELVVLSACETGLGDILGNEGVYGLQRAFKIAGVDKIIMSLWSVPDDKTREMMVLFYTNWLQEGMELSDAFQAAQQAMRARYPDHYYWAGFVLIE